MKKTKSRHKRQVARLLERELAKMKPLVIKQTLETKKIGCNVEISSHDTLDLDHTEHLQHVIANRIAGRIIENRHCLLIEQPPYQYNPNTVISAELEVVPPTHLNA